MHDRVLRTANERLLEGLFGSGGCLSFALDPSGVVLEVEGRPASLAEIDIASASELPWTQLWSEGDQIAARSVIEKAEREGSAEWEGERQSAAGRVTRWHVVLNRLPASDRFPARLLVTARDVTEAADLRAALTTSTRRTNALIAATAEIVWHSDFTQGSGDTYGWAAFTGQREPVTRRDGWISLIHPEDRDATVDAANCGVARGVSYVNEYRLWHHSGRWRWVEDRAVPVRADEGAVVEWVGVISDIDARKAAEEELRVSEERFRLAVSASRVGVWDVDLVRNTRSWSTELTAMLGLPPSVEPSEEVLRARVHPDDWALIEEAHQKAFVQPSGDGSVTFRVFRADNGALRWMLSRGSAVFDGEGVAVRRLGTIQDITERRRLELDLRAGERLLSTALRAGRMVAWQRESGNGLVTRSENAEEILGNLGQGEDEFLDRVPSEDRPLASWNPELGPLPQAGVAQFRYHHPDGRLLWLETRAEFSVGEDRSPCVSGVTADVTERKLAEAALVHAANHDPLTGLLNRIAFGVRLEQALSEAAAEAAPLHILFVDIDSLKVINDSLGHDAGDAVVAATARQLESASPPFRLIARLGGDEFAAVLNADDRDGAERAAQQLIRTISQPVVHNGRTLVVSASVGLASYPADGKGSTCLMKAADLALYGAKQAGKRRVHVFEPHMRSVLEQRTALKAEAVAALAADQIVPFYQPKLDLQTGAVVGFEALARWSHPTRGLLTPAVFGFLFEDGEIAAEIGSAMLRGVLRDLQGWLSGRLPIGRVAVNCSGHEFRAGFAETLLDELRRADVPATNFEVEVTEGVMLGRDTDAVACALAELQQAGAMISLDDFGTGYASLVHLQKFTVDEIKIDRSFVAAMEQGPNRAIISAIVAMGSSLGLTIVAEGVETLEQAELLRSIGCHRAQGFLFGKPMSAGRVPWYVSQNLSRQTAHPPRDDLKLVAER